MAKNAIGRGGVKVDVRKGEGEQEIICSKGHLPPANAKHHGAFGQRVDRFRRLRRAKGHRLIHKPLKARKVQGIHGRRRLENPRLQPLERPEGVVPYGDHLKAKGQHVLVEAKVHHALKIEVRFFAVGHGLGQGSFYTPQHLLVGGNAAIVKAQAHDRTHYGDERKGRSRSGPHPGGKGQALPSKASPWHT